MDLNFLLRCALSLALAGALARSVTARSATAGAAPDGIRAGLGLLVTWAVCSGLLAFFADDPAGHPATASGRIHLALAFIAFTAMAAAAVVISVSLRPVLPSVALPLAAAGAAAYLLLGAAARHRHAPGGLCERIFLGIELLWIAVVAARIALGRPDPVTARAPARRPRQPERR
jgi:hypothetical protein